LVLIVGHRGGRNVWPENSLSGFRNVARLPVDAVEFDVHLTAAGELLVIHDPTLDRTTESSGLVVDLAPEAHRAIVLKGGDGEAVPSLKETLDVLAPTGFELHVELKSDADHRPYPGIVPAVLEQLSAYDLADRCVLTSFDPAVLEEVRRAVPGGRRLASVDRSSSERYGGFEATVREMAALVDYVAIEKSLMREHWSLICSIIAPDRLAVWTTNEADELTYWLDQPVRSLTTDRPDLAAELKGRVRVQ
jgi:glycerophosphoryl diester phosphodiesterase